MSKVIKYTIYMNEKNGWFWDAPQVFYGTGTRKDGDELIIAQDDGAYININYSRVRWYTAEPVRDAETVSVAETLDRELKKRGWSPA